MTDILLETRNLKKYFPLRGGLLRRAVGQVRAVDGVDLEVRAGEALGIVGESGSGKTTLGKTVLRLLEPTAGQILFDGQDITHLSYREMQSHRVHMQMIFQNPYSSLNPRMRVKDIVAEPLVIHRQASGRALEQRVRELLDLVGLADTHLYRFPHEFSGGQRQRIGIARALALEPQLLVLDEPTSALDVSVQAQVLNLLINLQQQLNLTYLFISHDLGVIRYICDKVALMYLGRVVEMATVKQVFEAPKHPYTQALLSAMPEPDPDHRGEEIILEGEISAPTQEFQGCRFAPRCPVARAMNLQVCWEVDPPLQLVDQGHLVACHLYTENVNSSV